MRVSSETGHDDCVKNLQDMCTTIYHRGPDAHGLWHDRNFGLYLGHRRLSIIDLSEHGAQPMESSSGRFVLTYNGEIYNFRELREELESRAVEFRGDCDTEVLVNAIEAWGMENALKKVVGMFAFALWDRKEYTLYLARDRLGEKPLFYGWCGGDFVFGSELKALRAYTGFANRVDRDAVASFMRFSYVPSPQSIYEGISKLTPGTFVSMSLEDLEVGSGQYAAGARPVIPEKRYWRVGEGSGSSGNASFGSEQEATQHLDDLIRNSVRGQMISDVPLGALLSGGIDSSTVVAVMQSMSEQPIKTFTIGFHEQEYNEAVQAREIADYLGTDHTELYLSGSDALDVVPKLPDMYDEPFADSSQIPTHLVSRLARSEVTVALSGDGGDELFGGYTRYLWADKIWNNLKRIPAGPRRVLAAMLSSISAQAWLTCYNAMEPLVPERLKQRNAGEKVHALGRMLREGDRESLYLHILSHWTERDSVVRDAREYVTIHRSTGSPSESTEFVERMMYCDLMSYLPDDILTKLDRASMNVSLETRIPLLDRDIVDFAGAIPLDYKFRNGVGKWLLRQVLERYVPRRFFERPKMGFGVPVGDWLKGPLRGWAEDLLDPGLLERQGYLDSAVVQEKWRDHLSDRGNWQHHLWDVLMFQAWLERNA